MEKHFVGSEIGQLRSVMLHRPNLSLKRLTPSNCQELLFDDVLSVERAGEEHDIFANTLRQQGIEVLLLTDLLTKRWMWLTLKPGYWIRKFPIIALGPPLPQIFAPGWRICRTVNWLAI